MARKKRGAKARKGTRHGVLNDHKRQGRKLVPPLVHTVGDRLQLVGWHLDMLPDFLWIALLLGRRSDWLAVHSALDVIDRFVPDGKRAADGRLSRFALVPEEKRSAARDALQREAPHALPAAFGHGLGLYPTCPALWLYEDWLDSNKPDATIGIPLLRSLVADNADKAGVNSTRLRLAALARQAKHRKVSFQRGSDLELVPRYPHRLSTEEQKRLESVIRASWMSWVGADQLEDRDALKWPEEFWARSRELIPCQISVVKREELTMPEGDGEIDPEPLMRLSGMQAMLVALDKLGSELRTIQLDVVQDPKVDQPNAVLLGWASRLFRLLYAFLERPSAWVPDIAYLHLRPIVDGRIVVGWLIVRNDPEVFAAYQEHGLGRLKLLREHIKNDLGDDPGDEAEALLRSLDARVNLETDEMFQSVNLGSYANVGPREMAEEAGLKREYDISYAPLSSANHGEWPALRDSDTEICVEPLHGSHRVGAFAPPSHQLSDAPAHAAVELTRDGICQVFDFYGRDVSALFSPLEAALKDALASDEQNPKNNRDSATGMK